ncbi:mucin-12 isoform X2 [Gadus chalcogrammus]|uniref:mucin-12 isoform X2 n=1 Tax=Gadus chalcogrammus TaxID=1042646 RepID=UPI0024C4911A|nr:mucin-12 isoform X2 [Gadus chalcogrammus]
MKRKTLRRLRLSPNEESQLLREEQDRRRKIRIQQVREQARANALHIRTDVQRRREQELQLLAEELRQDWELQQSEKIQALQRLYEESLRLLGQGHRSAKENEPDWEAMAQHAEENQVKAKQRYREALKELTSQRHREQQEHNRPADARRKALQAERERAAWVASLPPPPPHPMETMEENRPPAGRPNVSGFSATHHHCPEPTVDREVAATQPDAHEEAEQEARRLLERGSEAERQREERQETARLRGRSALKREQLTQDRERLVVELEHMQQTELLRRRQQVAQMPAQIFQPLHRRREAREDGQRDMEFAFEDMYTGERRVKGDLVLQLVPEPLPAPSTTSSQDQELDVTVDDGEDTPPEVTPETEAGHRGNGQHPGPATARVEPPQPAHRQALRKLLNRIRAQRDKGWDQGRDHPQEPDLISSAAACQPPVRPDEEPERDSSIDTGSLSVEEHGREASSPLLPPEPAPVLETTGEESVLAPLPPEVLSSRMYEWKEREAALEREKRQQMALLEDLEEQKSRLEAMLRDAQRERQDMQAAVNQDVSLQEPEVPAAPPPPAASELEGSTGKDQSSRIRQHQRRLLEQNRVHQRSVAVARQRLEQYQRALRIRHSAGIMPRPPAGPPAGLAPRPPLGLSAETAVPVATPPAPVPRPTERAMPASAPGEIPVLRSDAWRTPPPPRRPDLRPAPSLTPDPTRFPRGSPEDDANGPPPARRAGLSAWLTDSIMERATGHLPESLRSPPAAPNPFTHRPLGTAESVTAGVRQSSRLAGKGDVERQRFELLEACRRTQEQREEVAQQLREQEEAQRRREAERCSHEAHQGWGEESRRKAEQERCTQEERRRREEQQRHEEQRRLEEERRRREEQQRHEEQRRLEEERRRREEQQREEEEEGEQKRHDEEQREQMRRQREALQALINTETQGPRSCPVAEPPAAGEEEEGRSRLSLLSSLLRAIEESHGGSLSHLEEQPQPAPCTPAPPASDPGPLRGGLPSQSWEAARAQRPPLTRVKLGAMVTLPGQHELSVIQEVDTPGERSLTATGPEDVFGSRTLAAEGAPGSWDRHQRPGALLTHVEQRSAVCSPLPDSELSTELSWKKRLLEQPPETEPGPSRPSWGPTEQPLTAVGAPGSRDGHQRPRSLQTHVEQRSAVCSDSELSTELSWRKRQLEQPPETEPGPSSPSRPSWGPSEQPLAPVGAPGSRDRHQRPGALQTHVEQRSAVCSDSELSTELSWRKRQLEHPPETEPGPSRPSWGPSEQPLAAVGAPGSRDGHQRPGALLTHVDQRSAVCSPLPDSELSTELSWKKRQLEQPPETEPGPSRPSWGPSEQPCAAVGAPGSRDRHQRPGALQTHVEQRSAVSSDSELSTELSWRKRLLEQPPETEPGPSRPSSGPSEQPLAAVGAPGSRDGHQRPGALLTHVDQRSAVCSPLPDSELSTELSWKKRQLEQPPETEPGPSRPSWGPSEQPLAAVGAPGSRDRHQRPGALLTHVDQRSAVCSPLPDSELSTELSWRKRLLEQPPEREPGPSRPSWGPSEQPLAAVGAPRSRDRHRRPGALLTHVEERSAVCSPLPDSELSTELSWRKRLLEQPPETEPGPSRPSWGPSEQPLAAVGAPGSRDGHQRPGALLTHVEQRSAVCSDSELSTELSWRKRQLEHPPETEPDPSRPSWGPSEQPLAPVGAPRSRDRHQRPGALLTHVEETSAVCSPLPDSELSTELSWKKRQLEQPPETEPGPSRPSWGPSEQGGRSSGSSVSPGSVGSGYTANSGSAGRPAYPDDSSSSSLSTGSYVTTGPEHDSAHTDVSEPHSGAELIRPVNPTDGFLAAVSPPSAPSSRSSCSVALSSVADSSSPGPSFSMGPQTSPGSETTPGSETSPGRAVAALFHDSSIQRIIDKYTRELNASLCSSADTTGSSIAVDENQVPPSPAQVPTATPPTETAPPRPGLEWDNAVNQILEQFSESVSLVQDISFRPLIGQQDQSSCLAADGRHSAVGRLIGQPSAQSSMIGQLPGPSMRAGANEGAWDSTLSRMIDRLSHQPCSLWSSGGRDFYSSQLMGRLGLEQSSVSFDEAQEDSRMRPLIGQLDESGVRRPGSTGGLGGSVGPTGSDPVQVLGHPPAPESPLHRPPPHQPGSDWPSSGPGRYASQLIGQPGLEETSLWLDDAPEEGGMKPLIGQLYDSAVQAAGSSGEVGSSSSSSSLGSVESVLVAPPPPPPPASQPSAPLCPPHQPSAPQPSDGQLVRRLEFDQSSLWLDDGREEGGMRHLIGRLDESGAQAAGSSGYGSSRTEQTRLNRGPRDGTGGSPQAAVDPDLSAVPEPEVPDTRRRPPLQDPSAPLQQDPECSEGFADQDSFHPLLAQVTLNESLEPSMTFHLPQQEVPSSPDGSHQSTGREEAESTGRPLTPQRSEEEDQGSLVDPSPEHPRAQEEEEGEEVPISSCLDSFCQLASSQPPSVLLESPEEGEEPMVGEGDETDGCKRLVPARDSTSQEPTNQTGSNLKSDTPIWDTIIGTAWEKGILEQSEITLVSLSDESTLGPDTTTTEDQEVDSTLLPEEEDPPATQESPPSQPGVVLEPQAGPAGGLQEAFQRKRLALIQRSALRVEEIRAKRVLAKTQPSNAKGTPPQPSQTQGTPPQPSQTQGKPPKLTQAKTQSVQNRAKTKLIHSPTGPHLGQARPEDHPRSKGQAPGQLVSSKTKEPQIKTMVVPVRTAVVPARPDGKPKHPSPVSNAGMKGCEEVRTCTPSQKKLEGLEMQLRTRRLYGRLEEVKQQREVKSKQESYAQNRLKAKEFHQKTLQKLRAKQTAQ